MAEVERARRIQSALGEWLEAMTGEAKASPEYIAKLTSAYESVTTAIALMGGEE